MLTRLGCPAEKIAVVPNGADVREGPPPPRPPDAPPAYLLYFGALERRQGVDVALRAFARLADFPDLHFVICASHRSRERPRLERLATKRVRWFVALEEPDLAAWRAHAVASVAPLTECARNVMQGCAPLKILESAVTRGCRAGPC